MAAPDILPTALIGGSGLWVLYFAVKTSLTMDRPLAKQLRTERERNDELRETVDQLRDDLHKAEITAARANAEMEGQQTQLRYAREEVARLTQEVQRGRRGVWDE